MSKTVDERVVEMRFDNKNFESNVATSMSTLEKFKQKLKFDGATKGLEDINSASKRVNMSGLGSSVDAVSAKFSALQVMGVTALANITNSAVNAGKKIVSALTLDPVKDGFAEYETQMNAVQTILANTQKEGTNVTIVNKALDELNTYADKTIYNFTEMTRNIGTFTAAGVKLDTSVNAIKGIANLAAVSGSTSQQASTAMYQLSQALAAGKVQLMDWNSVVNAGMGGQVFQDALIRTSEHLKTGAKEAIKTYGTFRESLTKGEWLTTEVLTETLNQISGAYSKADLIAQGYSEAQAEEIVKLADTATDAATKVKTFTQLIDTLKEALGSGWTKTWQLIIGDFEEAKEMWTSVSDVLGGFIQKFSDARNTLIESALGKGFSALSEKMRDILEPAKKAAETVQTVKESISDLGSIVDDVILGKFGNGKERFDALTESGYNWCKVQNQVNEKLGNTFRYTEDQIAAQDKLLGFQEKTTEATSEASEETGKLTDIEKRRLVMLASLSDEQLRSKGYTEEQIAAFNELRDTADKLGIPLKDFIMNLDEINGRWILLNSFKNIGKALLKVFQALGGAWREIFPAMSADNLFDIIAGFHKFTSTLILNDEQAENLKKTFAGLFAVLDIIKTLVGGGLSIAFKVLSAVLDAFDLNILDVTASIGDGLVAFHDWLLEGNVLSKAINGLISKLPGFVAQIKEWFNAFKETPAVQKLVTAIEAIHSAFTKLTNGDISLGEFAASLGENLANALQSLPGIAIQIGKDFIAGFQNGIGDSVTGVIDSIVNFCLNFVNGFKEALGVHSPSWKAYETATDFFQGFINGASAMIGNVVSVLKSIGSKIVEVFKSLWDYITDESGNIEWGKLFAGGEIVGMILALKQLADAFSSIAGVFDGVFDGVGDLLSDAGEALKSFSKVLNGVAWDLKANALLKMAIAIGVLVAAIWVLTTIDDPAKLWQAVGIIVVLAGVLIGLSVAMDKLSSASVAVNGKAKTLDIKGIQNSIIQIGLALLLMAAAVKLIGGMDADEAKQGFIGLAGMAVGMIAFLAAIGGIARYSGDVSAIGSMMKKLAVAMILMAIACKLIGMLSAEEIGKGILFAGAFGIFTALLVAGSKGANKSINKVGSMAIKLAIAMALLVGVCKLVNLLSTEEMIKGGIFAAAFVVFIGVLVAVTKIGSEQKLAKVSDLALSVSVSLMLLVGVCKLVGMLTVEEMIKGAVFVAAFVILLKVLMKTLTISNGQKMAKVAGTILAMSAAIAILAAVAILLSFMDIGGLAKGIVAVGLLSAMMTAMIKALKGAQNVKGAILMMAIAIGVMAASIVALSFIDTADLAASTGAMVAVMSAFALMIKSMKGLKDVKIGPLIALTGVVLILAGIIYILQDVDPLSAISTAGSLSVLMLSMSVALKIISTVGNNATSALKGVLLLTAMAVPLLAFVGVLAVMQNVTVATNNVIALVALAAALTLLLIPLTVIGNFVGSALLGVLSLTAMAVPLLVFILVLKQMDGIENASEKITALTTMMTSMTILLAILAVVGLGGPAAIIGIGSLVVLFAAIGGLAVAIGALMEKFPSIQKFLDSGLPVLEQLAGSIGTMIGKFIGGIGEGLSDSLVKMGEDIAAFMDQLAIASDNAAGVKGESFDGVKQLMGVMADIGLTTVGTTFADIFTLGGTSMEKFQTDGVAFFDAMKAIGEASQGVSVNEESMQSVIGVAKGLAELQSSLEPIGGVISWFAGKDDLGTFGENIGDFMNSMKLALGSLDGFTFNEEAMTGIITASTKLATFQESLEPIGGVITWFTGRDDLGTFGVNVGQFISSMKLALSSLDGVTFNEEALTSIVTAATKLSTLQSSLEPIGGVITWFTGRDDLGTFGTNVGEFISSMKTALTGLEGVVFDEDALTSIITAATKLGELQSSLEPIGGVISWFTGRDDLGTFGTSVSQFISSMKTALVTLDGATLDEEALDSVIAAATKLSEFQSTLEPMGGVISWFSGRTDLGTFGTNVGLFADAMGKLKTGMGEDGITEATITSITNTGEALVALQEALPEEHWFDGKMNLSDFSERIDDFATAMGTFGTTASEIDSGAVSTVISTAYRIKNLIESLVDLDTSGLQAFTGIGTGGFGADGAAYEIAQTISAFSKEVANINTEAVTVAVNAARKLKTLIASLVGLDTSGIENFKPGKIADQMKNYSDKVIGIDTSTVSISISCANRLKSFISSLAGLDTTGVSLFKPGTIGSALSAYSYAVSGFNSDSVTSSIAAATRLKNFIASLAGFDSTGVSSFKTAVNELSTVNIDEMAKAFSGASTKMLSSGADMINGLVKGMRSKLPAVKSALNSILSSAIAELRKVVPKFEDAGGAMITRMSGGMTSKRGTLTAALTSCLSSTTTIIRGYYSSFYDAGGYLVSGFAAGISANTYLATAKAKAMANAANQAAKSALGINSPSKVFKKLGSYTVEGFVVGMAGLVKSSSVAMANTALNGTKQAISNIAEMMSTDSDYQPTIRPVLDLSDVESGAGSITGMFNNNPAIGVNGNLRAIGSMINENRQNGSSDDIISAINKLRKGLDNVGNTSYTINGITYDDGSDIHDAISAIVRKARIERRV